MWSSFILSEWYRSVLPLPKHRQQNRDFLWLVLSLFITLALLLVLLGGRNGFLDKVSEISMGYIPQAGIPVWLMRKSTADSIAADEPLVAGNEANRIHPYQWIESNFKLPETVWGGNSNDNKRLSSSPTEQQSLIVWVISRHDPLWGLGGSELQQSVMQDPFLPRVLLNRKEFEKYFKCDAYIKDIKTHAPYLQIPDNGTGSDSLACLSGGMIALPVKYNSEYQYFPFAVHWADRIPLIGDVNGNYPAFLLSEEAHSIVYAANYASSSWDMYLLPKEMAEDHLVKELYLPKTNSDHYSAFVQCVGTYTTVKNGLSPFNDAQGNWVVKGAITLSERMPKPFITNCAQLAQVDFEDNAPQDKQYKFSASDSDTLTIQCAGRDCNVCAAVNNELKNLLSCKPEALSFNISKTFPPKSYAYLYVKDRQGLEHVIQKIESSQKYDVQPSYYSALVRFLFVDKIFNLLVVTAASLLAIFFAVFLWTQIGIIVGHRRHDYGIMLAMGRSKTTLAFRLICQTSLSYGVALLLAAALYHFILQPYLSDLLLTLSKDGRFLENVILVNNNLLELTSYDWLALISFSYSALLMIIGVYFFFRMDGLEPCNLF